MTTEERRKFDRRDDHCGSHEERCQMHKDLSTDVYEIRDEAIKIRTERKTEKYFYGVIGSIILLVLGGFQWVLTDNLKTIRDDMSSVKSFISSNSVSVATNAMEISNLKERICKLEESLEGRAKK